MHSFGPAVRNHFLFHYVISGKGALYTNVQDSSATVYYLSEGCGFMIEPGRVNHYQADENDPWEYIWVEFGGLRAKEFVEFAGLSTDQPVYRPDTPQDGERLLEEMRRIVHGTELGSLYIIGHFYLFMDILTKSSQSRVKQQEGRLREFYIKEAVTYIEQNYAKKITVEDMAQICRLDRSYFGKIFKSVMGQSPQEFLIRYRMEKAAQALILTDAAVKDVGSSVGYPNGLHFSRAFKNIFGVSPREYRQKNKIIRKKN